MSCRVQVILSEQERESFRRLARQEGLSLSAWLRKAGVERAGALAAPKRIRTQEDLTELFGQCDEREHGREPDWEEHLEVIRRSRLEGTAGGR